MSLKKQLLETCIKMQESRVENFRKAMNDAQQSANSEERSTAGDKHDTARAMSHNIRDMNAKQLQEALRDLTVLEQIKPDVSAKEVRTGSIVHTTLGNYFISISLGEIKILDQKFFAISAQSPIGQALTGKLPGESFNFRDKEGKITSLI